MGWLSNLFKKQTENPTQSTYAEMLSGYAPIFSQFGQNIYASDVVQQAIGCIVEEVKKLNVMHVRKNGTDLVPVKSSVQRVLSNPNPLMTTSEFLEKITWLLFLNYNVFIIPVYRAWTDEKGVEKRHYEALYPILPSQVNFIEDARGELYVKFGFSNGQEYTLRYSDVIHIKKNYSVNQYMGGNEQGQPDNDALLKTLDLNHKLLQGIAKAMNASYAVNGVVKYNTMLEGDKITAALKELETKLRNSESGFLPLDLKYDYVPIKREIKLVDEPTLKFIDTKILRNYGVSLPILTGDFTKEQFEAFYQKAIEGLVINYGQGFTKTLFTEREKDFNNEVKFLPEELIFMSVEQKIQMVTLLSNTGALYENEKRVAFGLRPLAELEGKRFMSLNWVDVEIAKQYQIGNVGSTGGGENE